MFEEKGISSGVVLPQRRNYFFIEYRGGPTSPLRRHSFWCVVDKASPGKRGGDTSKVVHCNLRSTLYYPQNCEIFKLMNQKSLIFLCTIVVLMFIAMVFGMVFLRISQKSKSWYQTNTVEKSQTKAQQYSLDVGSHTILLKRNSEVLLPSGSKIRIDSFYFNKDNRDYENNSIRIYKTLKIYHNGYIYNISKSNCTAESVWHDDYSTQELKECNFTIDITQGKPETTPYNHFTKKFSSLSNSNDNRDPTVLPPSPITSSSMEPFLKIIPPYTQLYRDSGLQKYTYTTPIGDTVLVYTNYGFKRFKFSLPDDVFNKVAKTVQVGPLLMTLKVDGLSCYPPYMRKSGECNNAGEYPVYNKIDFTLEITQDTNISTDVSILDYFW
jgi:hypothetical protein